MKITQNDIKPEHCAFAKALNIPVSTKQCVEISNSLRYKRTSFAKMFLEEVIGLKRAVPFKKFNSDMGHKKGMAAGRFPQKAAKEFLKLIKSVEANAQVKGLNTSELKIITILANKASTPVTGGRMRRSTKRAHIEIVVRELPGSKKKVQEKKVKKEVPHVEEKKVDVPTEIPVVKPVPVVEEKSIDEPIQDVPEPIEEPKEEPVIEKTPVQEPTPEVPPQEKPEEPKEKPQPEAVPEKPQEAVAEPAPVQDILLKEVSSSDLLKQAQSKAAELKKKEVKDENVLEVENLYDALKKKGTLRDAAERKGDAQ